MRDNDIYNNMTLRQKMLLRKLSSNNYNVSKTAKEVGYKHSTSQSGFIYDNLRKITNKIDFFDPEKIKKDINLTFKLARKKEDITNMARINEHRSKIAGMVTDKSEINNKNPDKIIISYSKTNTLPVVSDDDKK